MAFFISGRSERVYGAGYPETGPMRQTFLCLYKLKEQFWGTGLYGNCRKTIEVKIMIK